MEKISVVIPTKNEQEAIGKCIQKIKKLFNEQRIDGEIIVADNSTDKTPEIARSLGAKVVVPDKLGYGYAYQFGFKHVSGDYIVMGDGDGTYDFTDILRLIGPLRKKEADLVMGSRLRGKIEKGAMPWLHKYIGNPVLTGFLNLFFKVGVSDAHCGLRAFTKEALERMSFNTNGMEFASEMLIQAKRKKLRIKEVPITYYRREGKSKLSSFSDGWRHLKFMLLHAPTYLYIIPGSVFLLIGALILVAGGLHLNIGYTPGIHSMVAGSLLFICGYQIIFLGLFAKIYGVAHDLIDPDKVTEFTSKYLSLGKGATLGLAIFLAGLTYILYLIWKWVDSGYHALPVRGENMIAFTLVVVGLQMIFSSFFLSMISGQKR